MEVVETEARRVDALNAVNRALLPVVRHFLDALQNPQRTGWRIALESAVEIWGEARGLAIAHRTQQFLSCLMQCRPVPLTYSDPFDMDQRPYLSDDEADILAVLYAMRHDNTPKAREILKSLTGGPLRSAVVQTGLSLAVLLDTSRETLGQINRRTRCQTADGGLRLVSF